jgi:sulfatase modifying factor 1
MGIITVGRAVVCAVGLLLAGAALPARAETVNIETVAVGNLGDAADPTTGNLYGSVGYAYNIGKYEVTNAQYTAFLNAVDPNGTNTRVLYNSSMSTSAYSGGIDYVAVNSNGNKYVVQADEGNHPVTFVSWYDAARMANWMHNGQGTGDTENGVYTLTGNTSISGSRSANATWVIPTENEWYKAAYHQPSAAGGDTDSYWAYPTGSNTTPTGDIPAGGANSANFYGTNGFAVTQSTSPSSSQNYLTDAGAYSSADSYYGTFDQGGNVWEWNETLIGSSRRLRGGAWFGYSNLLRSDDGRGDAIPESGGYGIGFRLASIPEPASGILGAALSGLMLMRRRTRP